MKLRKLELVGLTITSYVVDIISSIQRINQLTLKDIRVPNHQISKRLIPKEIQLLHLDSLKPEVIHLLFSQGMVYPKVTCLSVELHTKYLEAWIADRSTYERFRNQFPGLTTFVVSVGRGKKQMALNWEYSELKIDIRDLVFIVENGAGGCIDDAVIPLIPPNSSLLFISPLSFPIITHPFSRLLYNRVFICLNPS